MSYHLKIITEAKLLRRKGFSLSEISQKFNISKSTASLWTSREKLTKVGLERVRKRQDEARKKAFGKIALKRKRVKQKVANNAQVTLKNLKLTPEVSKLLLAFLFWTEGDKKLSSLGFANSDPLMIKTFLLLLRSSYKIDELKLRALVHLHEYHNEKETLNFWSHITNIPLNQFNKSYLKPHTGKRKKEGYKGSMHLKYYDHKVARELASIYNMFAERI